MGTRWVTDADGVEIEFISLLPESEDLTEDESSLEETLEDLGFTEAGDGSWMKVKEESNRQEENS